MLRDRLFIISGKLQDLKFGEFAVTSLTVFGCLHFAIPGKWKIKYRRGEMNVVRYVSSFQFVFSYPGNDVGEQKKITAYKNRIFLFFSIF